MARSLSAASGSFDTCTDNSDCSLGYTCTPATLECSCFIGWGHAGDDCEKLRWQSILCAVVVLLLAVRALLLAISASGCLFIMSREAERGKLVASPLSRTIAFVVLFSFVQCLQCILVALSALGVFHQQTFDLILAEVESLAMVTGVMPTITVLTVWMAVAKASSHNKNAKRELRRSKQLVYGFSAAYLFVVGILSLVNFHRSAVIVFMAAVAVIPIAAAIGAQQLVTALATSKDAGRTSAAVHATAVNAGTAAFFILLGAAMEGTALTRLEEPTNLYLSGMFIVLHYEIKLNNAIYQYSANSAKVRMDVEASIINHIWAIAVVRRLLNKWTHPERVGLIPGGLRQLRILLSTTKYATMSVIESRAPSDVLDLVSLVSLGESEEEMGNDAFPTAGNESRPRMVSGPERGGRETSRVSFSASNPGRSSPGPDLDKFSSRACTMSPEPSAAQRAPSLLSGLQEAPLDSASPGGSGSRERLNSVGGGHRLGNRDNCTASVELEGRLRNNALPIVSEKKDGGLTSAIRNGFKRATSSNKVTPSLAAETYAPEDTDANRQLIEQGERTQEATSDSTLCESAAGPMLSHRPFVIAETAVEEESKQEFKSEQQPSLGHTPRLEPLVR